MLLPRTQTGTSGKAGVEILGCVEGTQQGPTIHLSFRSGMGGPIGVGQVALMSNSLGLVSHYVAGSSVVPPMGSQEAWIPLGRQGNQAYQSMLSLSVATTYENYVLAVPLYPHLLIDPSSPPSTEEFRQGWAGQGLTIDQPLIPPLLSQDEALKAQMRKAGIGHLSTQSPGGCSRQS